MFPRSCRRDDADESVSRLGKLSPVLVLRLGQLIPNDDALGY
jgi:hypothetical protein